MLLWNPGGGVRVVAERPRVPTTPRPEPFHSTNPLPWLPEFLRNAEGLTLVVVDSPVKAKAVARALSSDYAVMASPGAQSSLPTRNHFSSQKLTFSSLPSQLSHFKFAVWWPRNSHTPQYLCKPRGMGRGHQATKKFLLSPPAFLSSILLTPHKKNCSTWPSAWITTSTLQG